MEYHSVLEEEDWILKSMLGLTGSLTIGYEYFIVKCDVYKLTYVKACKTLFSRVSFNVGSVVHTRKLCGRSCKTPLNFPTTG